MSMTDDRVTVDLPAPHQRMDDWYSKPFLAERVVVTGWGPATDPFTVTIHGRRLKKDGQPYVNQTTSIPASKEPEFLVKHQVLIWAMAASHFFRVAERYKGLAEKAIRKRDN